MGQKNLGVWGHFAAQISFILKVNLFRQENVWGGLFFKNYPKQFSGGWGPMPPNFSSANISETVRILIRLTETIIVALGGNLMVYGITI
jgi:hypothetical protein